MIGQFRPICKNKPLTQKAVFCRFSNNRLKGLAKCRDRASEEGIKPMNAYSCTSRTILLALFGCICLSSPAETLQLISNIDPGQPPPAGGSGDSWVPVLSADGRFVLFSSAADNLLLTTTNTPMPAVFPANLNVFLRDRTNQTTALVSVNLSGVAGGNGDSLPVDL